MANVQHKDAPLGHRHATHNWSVASESARTALAVTAADVGKDCLQTDTSPPTVWKLVRVTGGVSWAQLGAGMTAEQQQAVADSVAAIALLKTPTFIVKDATGLLDAEIALTTLGPVSFDYGTSGQVKIVIATALGGGAPAAGLMSGGDKVKLDGIASGAGPSTPLATPINSATGVVDITDSTTSTGDSSDGARKNHTHGHGNRGGGTLHATALGGGSPAAGFMSGADKVALDANTTKLAGIASGANVGPADPTVAPQALSDSTATLGATGKYATEGHVHPHGNRAGGTLHATALGGGSPAAGFMSGADKVALDANTTKLALLPAALTIDTTTTPSANTDAGAAGSGTNVAPLNHRHPHGTGLAGGTTHATALGGGSPANGFMSGADKVALDANTTYIAGVPALLAAKANKRYDLEVINVATKVIVLADENKLFYSIYTGGAVTLILPQDATINLPVGFSFQCMTDNGTAEQLIEIASEVPAANSGVGQPARGAERAQYSATTPTYRTYGGPLYLMTAIKVAANRWFVSGHYAP